MMDFEHEIANAQRRLINAREIANEFKGDDRLHRLFMQTVFVLEDVLFVLRQAAERDGEMLNARPKLKGLRSRNIGAQMGIE